METVGFVGLGTIGGVVAGNIQKAGYAMVVYDIVPEARQAFGRVWRAIRAIGGGSCTGVPGDFYFAAGTARG